MSHEYSTLRTWLLPNILKFLGENKHVSLPHRVFECGDVVYLDEKAETRVRSERRVVVAIADNEVGYEDIQAVLYTFLREIGVTFKLGRFSHPSFLSGRTAQLTVNGKEVGVLGEVNPVVLANFGLETPVAAFELSVDGLVKLIYAENV
jgi:phenylalanyl-tRNA synthetase beta chain